LKRTKPASQFMSVEELRAHLKRSNASRELGFEITEAGQGRAVVQMRVHDRHRNIHSTVHGGVLASLADSAGGMATHMAAARGSRVATIELKINFLEPVEGGIVTAEARVVRIGKHTSVVDCDVRENSRLVAKALATYFVFPPSDKKSRLKRRT